MSDQIIESVADFLNKVTEFRKHWKVEKDKELWFRGEGQDFGETKLTPKLYRPKKGESLRPVTELLKMEKDVYDEFSRLGTQLGEPQIEPEYEDWDWYFLMQHHGAVTRLLDWTDGALVALHFASRPREPDGNFRFVYVLAPDQLQDRIKGMPDVKITEQKWKEFAESDSYYKYKGDESEWKYAYLPANEEELAKVDLPNVPLLLEFSHITRRIAAQRSRLIVFGRDPRWLLDRITNSSFPMETFKFAGESVQSIRRELRDCGMTESVIYPDLDGLGRQMDQRFNEQK